MAKITKKNQITIAPQEYAEVFIEIKRQVQEAQIKSMLAANKELLKLYWSLGKTIVEHQQRKGWGSHFIDQVAKDLQRSFPGVNGFSRTNIFNMRAFYLAYEKVQQAAGQFDVLPIFNIPWWHNIVLLAKVKDVKERFWYAQKAIDNGWSRNILTMWIESDFYHREGKTITNFSKTLPQPHSDMAQQSLKDPYIFDFLTLHKEHVEKDIEQGLIDNVQKLLIEMGKGFALVGRQYHLPVDQRDYYIDLLFYHYKLRCFVVVELKAREFEPGDAGQLNFYLSVVDDLLRHPEDKPTIGLILCKNKSNIVAEYALRGFAKPIGVAGYETDLVDKLPKEFKSSLPSIEEIEKELIKLDLVQEKE